MAYVPYVALRGESPPPSLSDRDTRRAVTTSASVAGGKPPAFIERRRAPWPSCPLRARCGGKAPRLH